MQFEDCPPFYLQVIATVVTGLYGSMNSLAYLTTFSVRNYINYQIFGNRINSYDESVMEELREGGLATPRYIRDIIIK